MFGYRVLPVNLLFLSCGSRMRLGTPGLHSYNEGVSAVAQSNVNN